MSAYDDLAFAGARRHEARPMRCAACDEDVNHLLPDTDECPVCGGPLSERVERNAPPPGARRRPADGVDLANLLRGAAGAGPLGGGEDGFEDGFELGFGGGGELGAVPAVADDAMQALLERLAAADDASLARAPAAAPDAIDALRSFDVQADGAGLEEIALTVDGARGEVLLIAAAFGPRVARALDARLVLADPPAGFADAAPPRNAAALAGAVALMERGVATFAAKARAARAAGALALVVAQTADVWPYAMTDSRGELAAAARGGGGGPADVAAPALMISKPHGAVLLARCRAAASARAPALRCRVAVRASELECPICQERFEPGARVTQMPCQHHFHAACLRPWLAQRNSCPTCRALIRSTDAEWDREQRRARERERDEAHPETASWASWFD